MVERTDFEVLESEDLDGRIFLQFISETTETDQLKVECLSHLCLVKGRIKLVRGSRIVWSPFECALDQAKSFSVNEPESNPRTPIYITPLKSAIVNASDFPYHFPIENITLTLINGNMCCAGPNKISSGKNMTLMRADIHFRPLELITRPASMSSYSVEEVAFDKLTLLRGRLTMPSPYNLQRELQVQVQVQGTPINKKHATHSPTYGRAMRSPSNRRQFTVSSLASSLALQRLPMALEYFIFLLCVLGWLLCRAYYVTSQTERAYTVYTVLFVLLAAVVIFSFRGFTLHVLLRWFAVPESNGRSFYVNGWNAWSFAGSVLQGKAPPVYGMPGMFVKAFHDGGLGTSLHINLGHGDGPPYPHNHTSHSTSHTSSASSTVVGQLSQFFSRKVAKQAELALHSSNSPVGKTVGNHDDSDGESPRGSRGVFPVPAPITIGSPASAHRNSNRSSEPPHGQSATEFHAAARDYIASDMFTLIADLRGDCGLVLGFLSQRQQFGCIAVNKGYDRLSIHLSGDGAVVQGAAVQTDWLCLYAVRGLEEPFAAYMAVSREENQVYSPLKVSSSGENQHTCFADKVTSSFSANEQTSDSYGRADSAPFTAPDVTTATTSTVAAAAAAAVVIPAGWCSWYHFYDRIAESVLLKNLALMQRMIQNNHLDAVGFSLFQVDDGYQAAWGDWAVVEKSKFPSLSLYAVVQGIKKADLTPGLWLAPFSCDKHSAVAKLHPHWILRNSSTGRPSNSANCGKFFYGLDTTLPEVQEHIRASIEVARHVWGFEYLKLDFLYSAVLAGAQHNDRSQTGAQVMQQAMRVVTGAADGAFILGCGAPLGSMIGHVQANRVSADTGLSWVPDFPLPSGDKWNLPCARNCVRNTLTRLFMHRQWWINDPDCIMLRDKLSFTQDEIIGIATTKALSAGSFIVSDDLAMISPGRWRLALQLLPPVSTAAVALDLMEQEVPELFRQMLPSNYSTRQQQGGGGGDASATGGSGSRIRDADDSCGAESEALSPTEQGGSTPTVSPFTPPNPSGSPVSSRIKGMLQMEMQRSDSDQSLLWWQTSTSSAPPPPPALPPAPSSPEIPAELRRKLSYSNRQQHGSKSALDLQVLRQQKMRLKERLKKENKLNEADLLGAEHTLFTVCHWGEASKKTHFVPVAQIFGAQYIAELHEKKALLDNFIKLQTAGKSSNRLQLHVEVARRPTTERPRYLMHLFSFWTQQYAHRAVTLQDCEVAFVDIPRHSAHIYSVSLTTDPTLPKYVGSNLHFSCGSELHRSCMLKTNPGEAEEYLKNAFSRRLEEENCAFSMPNTPREVDFAHEFGIAGLSNNNSNNNSNSKVSPVPVPEGSPASPCSPRPVVRTLLLSFETSALKNAHFGGAVWVFLPVNGASKAMVGTSFSQVVVQGPASAVAPSTHFPSEMYGGGMYGVGGDISSPLQPEHEPFLPSHSRSRHHTTATPASSRRGIGSADFTTTATESSSVHRVARVSAPDCRTHGSVFRIPVVRSSNSNCNSNIGNSRGNGGASGGGRGGGSSGEGSGGGGEGGSRGEGSSSSSSISHDHHNQITDAAEGRDYITISWVFDVLDA